jgi:MFS family permease
VKADIRTGSAINNPFVSLKYRNFRFYWIGMCISTTGTWMQNIAQPWLAYKLTDSPLLLSLIGALQFTPVLLFSLFAGVLIDRLSKKNIIFFTQAASLVITMALAVLVWTGRIQYWHLVVTSTLLGFINTLDMPARQSFVIELVGKEDLMNAIALNAAMFNIARVIGPAVAGIVMNYWGAAVCFFANSISFAAVLISLFFVKPMKIEKVLIKEEKVIEKIKDGLRYIHNNEKLFIPLMIMAVVGTFAPNFGVLVPVFSINILKQEEAGFGLLMSFIGIGAFLGAMLVAMRSRSGPKIAILYIVPLFLGMILIVVGFTDVFYLTGISLAITGFLFAIFASSANTTMQLNTGHEYLGRVMSVYSLVFAGSTPLGNLYAGFITDRSDARIGFYACGAVIIILMIPIYIYIIKKRRKQYIT